MFDYHSVRQDLVEAHGAGYSDLGLAEWWRQYVEFREEMFKVYIGRRTGKAIRSVQGRMRVDGTPEVVANAVVPVNYIEVKLRISADGEVTFPDEDGGSDGS